MNSSLPAPREDLVERFRRDLSAIADVSKRRLGVAVSGGPDSLALLLLAAAAMPGRVKAATVDHGLRPESAAEAAMVAGIAARLNVRHRTLEPWWDAAPTSNIQAAARAGRYEALQDWSGEARLDVIATAHHIEDQAETVLMRLARGSGLPGLSGIRPKWLREDDGDLVAFVRPLLGWHRQELADIVAGAGLVPAQDPSNADARFDRVRARALLADAPWLQPRRIAAAADHLADCSDALDWMTQKLRPERCRWGEDGSVTLDADGLPREIQRRLLMYALARFLYRHAFNVPGPKLDRLLRYLQGGKPATLAGIRAEPGPPWRFTLAPPRRRR
jgi:tRNA(Ile)-lysidine synthase